MSDRKPRIFAFVNGGIPGLLHVVALAEDGSCLAGHGSSNVEWARHDIGIGSDWKHDLYAAHYPAGYEVEWVDDPPSHPECAAAIAKANAGPLADGTKGETTP
jgi:hypothetical protein